MYIYNKSIIMYLPDTVPCTVMFCDKRQYCNSSRTL